MMISFMMHLLNVFLCEIYSEHKTLLLQAAYLFISYDTCWCWVKVYLLAVFSISKGCQSKWRVKRLA